jgi:hypothetical protein
MQRNKPCRYTKFAGIAFCFASMCAAPVRGVLAQDELATVREMLRVDAERALAQERLRAGGPPKPKAAAVAKPVERVAVLAIYGMTGKLKADVLVNGERKEFMQGSEFSRGSLKSAQEYRLVRIDDTCVHLSKSGTSGLRLACFDPMPQAAPARNATPSPAPQANAGMPFALSAPTAVPSSLIQRQP